MTRILVLTNMYPPHHYGGYELSCQDVILGLRDRGHDVTVLTGTGRIPGVADPPGEREGSGHGGTLRDLHIYWEDHRLVTPRLHRRPGVERDNQQTLLRVLDRFRPDVVSAWNMAVMSFGLLSSVIERQIPLVCVVCNDWLDWGPKQDPWARLFLGRPRLAAVAKRLTGLPTTLADLGSNATLCFVSAATRRRAIARAPWTLRDTTVVYSGIDREDFPPLGDTTRDRPWEWRLLYVGRIDETKGLDTLIQSLAYLPRATLEVVGRGNDQYLAELRILISRLGLEARVRFGVADRAALRTHYAAADVLVFPSTWEEPFGLVPVEAMASGTPVVATGTGGSSEFLVDGVNCLHHRPGDAASLASAVERLAGDRRLRRTLVTNGLATADELTNERLTDVLEAWHVAAATRFEGGRPPQRPRLVGGRAGLDPV